jgi:hypothetical protein
MNAELLIATDGSESNTVDDREPLLVQSIKANSRGCCSMLPCLRSRRISRKKLLSESLSRSVSSYSDVEKCSDAHLILEDSEEPRPLLRKTSIQLENKQKMAKELIQLKEKLKYHFANPFHKCRHHKRGPGKLIVLFFKILLATAQVC